MTRHPAVVIGIDVGTSGVRSAALDATGMPLASAAVTFLDIGNPRSPDNWWQATCESLTTLVGSIDCRSVRALAVDGTSGTVLAIDANGTPLAEPLMYSDTVEEAELQARVRQHMPANSAAGGTTSGLLKALHFQRLQPASIVHQADWIAAKLSGHLATDSNNALKTGHDPMVGGWPDWLADAGLDRELLPTIHAPGALLNRLLPDIATQFGLAEHTCLVAGTTDGCAAFLATGASQTGDAVTSLGSTITLKILSDKPLFAPEYGLYSHRLGKRWLAGGASNSGGKVLSAYFDNDALKTLSDAMDTSRLTGLDYYPLLTPGERFPNNDAGLEPRLTPRPADDVTFLQGMLEGMTRIEAEGYQRLLELGAPPLTSIRTVGGGSGNAPWSAMREAAIGLSMSATLSTEASVGVARLALEGLRAAGWQYE